jgi:Fur family transcriptional regulator, ferric uptake regulator
VSTEDKGLALEKAAEIYKSYLARQSQKMFYTKERALILEAVLQQPNHFSVDELFYDMHTKGMKVSRATLYRALSQLAESNILVEADFGHGHMHYELVGREPHEHLVCRECGKVFEVVSDEFSQAVQKLGSSQGFVVQGHKTQIYGTCEAKALGNPCPHQENPEHKH